MEIIQPKNQVGNLGIYNTYSIQETNWNINEDIFGLEH